MVKVLNIVCCFISESWDRNFGMASQQSVDLKKKIAFIFKNISSSDFSPSHHILLLWKSLTPFTYKIDKKYRHFYIYRQKSRHFETFVDKNPTFDKNLTFSDKKIENFLTFNMPFLAVYRKI